MGSGSTLLIGLVIAGFVALAWKLVRRGVDEAMFVIEVTGEGVEGAALRGTVPGHGDGDVREFVAGLELPPGSRIWGVPDRDGFQLRCSDEVPEHLRQRIRNYLYN